jgi:hypothetical protein
LNHLIQEQLFERIWQQLQTWTTWLSNSCFTNHSTNGSCKHGPLEPSMKRSNKDWHMIRNACTGRKPFSIQVNHRRKI